MDTNHLPDDLSALERRLAAWQPEAEGLDLADVLFAAGRATAPPRVGRLVWPAVAACLAVAAAALGGWAASERAGRLALAKQLRDGTAATYYVQGSAPADDESDDDAVAPASYLASYRALQDGLDAWPSMSASQMKTLNEMAAPHGPILQVGQLDIVLKHEWMN
jgi:hypothetical protein